MGSDDVHEPMSGAKIGRYQLRKKLAAGGMAEIYLARVTGVGGFSKDVVLKRILPQLAESEQFFRMFLDEARIAATLAHPNVVQVYDAGEIDGQYYIAMEFLDGADVAALRRHLGERDERIRLDHLVYIISCVCAGLHYAHDKTDNDGNPLGIVHRDVTPQNIFVTRDGGVKLVDFGIAKASNRLSRTAYGTLKGKLAYMAPEQCQGEGVDRRSDIYALGIVLYELSTGHNPHKGGAEYAMMKEIVEGTIAPPSTLVPDYPPGLEAIVMKAVAKHPDARYKSAREMQLALEGYIRDQQLPVSALTLSDYVVPLHDAIRAEQESRSQRFADELDAYEEYLAAKVPAEPKRRRRAEAAAAEDAAAAAASIDGLLAELREQDDDAQLEQSRAAATIPVPVVGASASSIGAQPTPSLLPTPSLPTSSQPTPSLPTPSLPTIDPPQAPVGIDSVNVRTGNRTVGIILGVLLGIGGLVGYLTATGKLGSQASTEPTRDAGAIEERVLPEFGMVAVDSVPDGASVWRYIGRTPIELLSVDASSTLHFRIESDGYETKPLVIAPADWSGDGENKAAITSVDLEPRTKKSKNSSVGWMPPEAAPPGKKQTGLLTIRSKTKGHGVWLFVGKTPSLNVENVSTRSGVELRFDSSGYAPSFVEVTERDYTEAGTAAVKATLLR